MTVYRERSGNRCERTWRGAGFQHLPVTFVVTAAFVRMEPFRKDGGGNRRYADEPPFSFRVFDEFANEKRRQNARRSHPMADFTGDGVFPAMSMAVRGV